MEPDKKYNALISKIAKNIKKQRLIKGLTQEEMVDYGFNYRHYQKIESGNYSFNLYTLFRLSQAFKVNIDLFFK